MARFYGEMWGKAETPATREGTATSGLEAHIRGWKIGVRVECFVNPAGDDEIRVYATRGSESGEGESIGSALAILTTEGGRAI